MSVLRVWSAPPVRGQTTTVSERTHFGTPGQRGHGATRTLQLPGAGVPVTSHVIEGLDVAVIMGEHTIDLIRGWTTTTEVHPRPADERDIWHTLLAAVPHAGHPRVAPDATPDELGAHAASLAAHLAAPLTVDGVRALPHLPMTRAEGQVVLWRGHLVPAPPCAYVAGDERPPSLPAPGAGTFSRIAPGMILTAMRGAGGVVQELRSTHVSQNVMITRGRATLRSAAGRALTTRPLTDQLVPLTLLLGHVMGEGALDAWLTVRAAMGEAVDAAVLAAALEAHAPPRSSS